MARVGSLGEFPRISAGTPSFRYASWPTKRVSNPYLSQIERGVRKPSADVLQQIAKALRISAEALYVRAGLLDHPTSDHSVQDAVLADTLLSERQKRVLLDVYETFRKENDDER